MSERDRLIEQIRELQEQRKILTTYLAGAVGGSIALLLSAQSSLAILTTSGLGLIRSYGLLVWISSIQQRINRHIDELRRVPWTF